jgi:hypothetical protein
MGKLQDIWDSLIDEQLAFHKLAARLIEKRLRDKDIILTDAQLAEIEAKLLSRQGDSISLSIEDCQLPSMDSESEEEIQDLLQIDLSDSEKDMEGLIDRFIEALSEATPEIVAKFAQLILEQLKEDAPSMLRDREDDIIPFELRLNEVWRKPLVLLEMLLAIALEAGDNFNLELRSRAAAQEDYVFEVLTRLHARACQIASEILVLLKSGYADGAHARWRSLHEIVVVGMLIESSGNLVAERYLLHDAVETCKAARQYQEHCHKLGYEPLSDYEFEEIVSTYHLLIDRFGPAYKGNYGWAEPAVEKDDWISFSDLEKMVGLDHLRPIYRLASHNVHANPKGVFFKLGLYPESQDILLAGPSNMGLADPGQATALSLAQITVTLLGLETNIDRLVTCNILMALVDEIKEEFAEVQNRLTQNEAA